MVFKDFVESLNKDFDNMNDTSKIVAMHFRIRTHGNSDAGATQPIPVTTKSKVLRKTNVKCDVALLHNGIISDYCDIKSKLSDSQRFARDFLTSLKLYQDITAHKTEVIQKTIGSTNKMVIMNARGEYCVIGDFNENEGCLYSNYGWRPYVYCKPTLGAYTYNGYNYCWGRHFKKDKDKYEHSLKEWDFYDFGF